MQNSVLMESSNVCPNVLKSFSFTDTVAPFGTTIRVEGVPTPTRSDIVAGDKPMSAKGSSVIGAFATNFHYDHTRVAW